MDRYIGRLLDNRYEILEIIGAGGMAVVYKARCHRLNRLVAIKILKDENLEDEDFCRRFHAESRAVAMLGHPNIVSVYDVSSTGDQDYIVMELIDGITLKQYMEKQGRLNWKETVHFATQIAKALEHAHSRGLVHRDIKPHNVMVLKNGSVKVADFGIARLMENENTMTKEALGSVHYLSPEQAKGSRVDNRSDLYSLGVVMYEMITGKTPYDGDSPVAVAIKHIQGGAPRPSTINPYIPKGLEQIIMKAMAHDLQDRYINATAMLRDLDEFQRNPNITFVSAPEAPVMEHRQELQLHPVVPEASQSREKKQLQPVARKDVQWQTPRKTASVDDSVYDDENPNRGKIGTIAVLICSLAAIVAIIVFMILLTENDAATIEDPTAPVSVVQQENLSLTTSDHQWLSTTAYTLATVESTSAATQQTVQTVATTVASQKPLVQMENLVNLTRQDAQALLAALGIANVQWVEQESMLPAGTVIGQSIAPNAQITQEQPLVVVCAAGAITMDCSFDMPFRTQSYYLTILLDGRPVVAERSMDPYKATATFQLTGKGRQTCQIYIDGELYYTVTVDFDAYAAK